MGESTDHAVLAVYNVDAGELSFSAGEFTRTTKAGSLPLPYADAGDRLLIYLFFRSANDATKVSSSQYLGSVPVE